MPLKLGVCYVKWRGFWLGVVEEGGVIVTASTPCRCLEDVREQLTRGLRRIFARDIELSSLREGNSRIVNHLIEYLEGRKGPPPYNVKRASVFARRVYEIVSLIPRGRVTSYFQVAQKAGKPKASRAVARSLALNVLPLVIPCHRVVRSDLSLGGYSGGVSVKRFLLEIEGVKIIENKVMEDCFVALSS